MFVLIQSGSPSTTFSNYFSPQNKALDWILSDTYSSDGLSDDRLLQRFSLATLYYSTNGGNRSHGGWLESKNECDWDSQDLICSQESALQRLVLATDNLSVRIPIEICHLTQLNYLSLYSNQLTGAIPSELGILTQLTYLSLFDNQLTGPLPSEFGRLTQLTSLSLWGNELAGSLPSELGILTQLTFVRLDNNKLTGIIPSSLCSASVTRYIYIDCGEIACACCLSSPFTFGTSCPA